MRKTVECKSCFRVRRHAAHGLCPSCYNKLPNVRATINRYRKSPKAKATHAAAQRRNRAKGITWGQRHPEYFKYLQIQAQAKKHGYAGLTVTREEFRLWLIDNRLKANGQCQCCGRVDELVIDHDHVTGELRGLICNPCNKIEGLARSPGQLDAVKRWKYGG